MATARKRKKPEPEVVAVAPLPPLQPALIRELRKSGKTTGDIIALYGITRQRLHQIETGPERPVGQQGRPAKAVEPRYGSLVMVERAPRETVRGVVAWICNCDCGKKDVVAAGFALRDGTVTDCGCGISKKGK